MQETIREIREQALKAIAECKTEAELEQVRVQYLGRSGRISLLSQGMRDVSKEDRPSVGALINEVRTAVESALQETKAALEARADRAAFAGIDVSLPGTEWPRGSLHPLTKLVNRAVAIVRRMGFSVAEGPDIETEWHCFDALNTPADHPARNEQDTFYMPDGHLLRTHTSSVQIRVMENTEPPIRIVAPGAAYRRDEVDATHLAQFTQLEGLYVDKEVSLADLKGTLEFFFQELLGSATECRFRPHFFPFTEPSFEIDIRAEALGGKWMELAGCGMVDPAVFEAICQQRGDRVFDPDIVSGFAFGMGLDRLAMHLLKLPDIRILVENDLRFLQSV